ncbi:hypothetical protein EV426DRAFT_601712, partial [Tirmania nivea]
MASTGSSWFDSGSSVDDNYKKTEIQPFINPTDESMNRPFQRPTTNLFPHSRNATVERGEGYEWYRVVKTAQQVGIETSIITSVASKDPNRIAVTEFLREQCKIKGIEYSHDEAAVTTMANILENLHGPQRQPRSDFYTLDIYVPVAERCGSTLPPPLDIKLVYPKQREAGITKMFASIATFNLFFGDNENQQLGGLDDDDSDMEDPPEEDPPKENDDSEQLEEDSMMEEFGLESGGLAEQEGLVMDEKGIIDVDKSKPKYKGIYRGDLSAEDTSGGQFI